MSRRADSEPLDSRLIEVSDDIERHELRDPRESFTAFVPVGSIARGRRIAVSGSASTVTRCINCHGAKLEGTAIAPPIVGRSPAYLLRQLVNFRTGARASTVSGPMQTAAMHLALDEMIAVAAYAGTRKP